MFENKKWDSTFKNRLAKYYDEMKWLYAELYHNDQKAFEAHVHQLLCREPQGC